MRILFIALTVMVAITSCGYALLSSIGINPMCIFNPITYSYRKALYYRESKLDNRDGWLLRNRITGDHLILNDGGGYADPVESTPEYLSVIDDVNAEISAKLGSKRQLGMCYSFWRMKKRILKDRYGITWRTPAEMNPGAIYD